MKYYYDFSPKEPGLYDVAEVPRWNHKIAPSLDEVMASTLKNRSGRLDQSISDNNALLKMLEERTKSAETSLARGLSKDLFS